MSKFTPTDHKILDFMGDTWLELAEQVIADNGESVYYWGGVKLVLSEGKPDITKPITIGE